MKIKSVWFQDLKGTEAEEFKKTVLGSKKVLDKAINICYTIIKDGERKLTDYDNPAWAYKQAHQNGFEDAVRKIIEVLTVDED